MAKQPVSTKARSVVRATVSRVAGGAAAADAGVRCCGGAAAGRPSRHGALWILAGAYIVAAGLTANVAMRQRDGTARSLRPPHGGASDDDPVVKAATSQGRVPLGNGTDSPAELP